MTSRVLVDASNLRVGGGVQVAASFLDELARASMDEATCARFPWLDSVDVEVSPLVHRNMTSDGSAWTPRIVDRTWRSARPRMPRSLAYDLEFDLFGPIYSPRRGRVRITGFADGTSLFPQPWTGPQPATRAGRQRLRRWYSQRFFARGTDHVVVEAEHVRKALIERWGLRGESTHVVPNAVNGVFYEPASWRPVPLGAEKEKMRVCYIARGYPHKNIALLGAVGAELRGHHGLDVEFVLTLTQDEWEAQSADVRDVSVNIGPIDVAQAPTVYLRCDASIFPSLLESFSATPLESLLMRCPLVASDRPFVSEIVGDAAEYFDPHQPAGAAQALARVLTSPSLRGTLVERGAARARQFPGPEARAERYFNLIQRSL